MYQIIDNNPEKVCSDSVYPKRHKGPKPINVQIELLAESLNLDPRSALKFVKELPSLPERAEGWFAFVSDEALSKKYFPNVTVPFLKYCQALHLVHAKIANSQFLDVCFEDIEGEWKRSLKRHTKSAMMSQVVSDKQGNSDIFVFPAQFGFLYRGCSAIQARKEFQFNEFGLSSLAVATMILTHPERVFCDCGKLPDCVEHLGIDCPGDYVEQIASDDVSIVPEYGYTSKIVFNSHWYDRARPKTGSASGFIV